MVFLPRLVLTHANFEFPNKRNLPASATTGKLGKASSLYPVETPGCFEESTASSSSSAEVTETLTLFSTVAGCFFGEGGFNEEDEGEVDAPSARAAFSSRAFFSKYCWGRNRLIKNQENVVKHFKLSLLTCFSFRASMTLTTSLVVAGGFNSNLPNCAYISGL